MQSSCVEQVVQALVAPVYHSLRLKNLIQTSRICSSETGPWLMLHRLQLTKNVIPFFGSTAVLLF